MVLPLGSTILETLTPWLLIGAFVIIFALIIWNFRRGGKKEEETTVTPPPQIMPVEEKMPLRIERSVTEEDASKAKNELRVLDVEREILSYALTRLYEAEAEGKLNTDERDNLTERYRDDMKRVEDKLKHDEATVQLHELEKTQADLVKMFYEKIDEVTRRITEFRTQVGIEPKTVKVQVPVAEVKETEKPVSVAKHTAVETVTPKPASKTKAEERIEEIRAEVVKELERLEQMETQE